ncbi:MAG TPA: adenylate/guanylate cyclase domain-containing protein, partial [Candidatus Limnocylindrales bacterium]|nr:adenylate/guanylate cyclase domain-containing protein [Candidatus Limnocylindrales bacterium]
MTCPACGTENREGAKFCSECGSAMAAVCPGCASPVTTGAKFCPECGTRLGDAPRPVPAAMGEPGPFLPVQPETQRRLVSVLFADLVGFTTLAEGRDAEQVRDLLGRYFDLASEIVGRYGGTVEKFIGDAVMAVWGTPIAHEDDAERAVRAALDLVDGVRTLGVELGSELSARAGVLTGEAAVTIGATNQGMVAGDLVNTASRLQSVAPPGTVLVGESTKRAASAAILFEEAGEQLLKGKAAPIEAWRALRVVAERGGSGRSEGIEPPFVGRETEFRLLRELFHATGRERRARLVSITGQGGIGKSRLAWEFSKYTDGVVETVYWHEGRCPSYGEGVSFWALGEMVRSRAGLAESDDPAATRKSIAASLERYVPDPEDRTFIEPALLALLGVEEAPPGGRERLFAGWRLFLERMSDEATVALVFEDLQWADDGLLDFIEHLLEWSRSYPIFILTLARPELLERRPTWGGGRASSSLALDPLSDDEMRELLTGMVPGLPAGAVRTILDRASGIPLYAVETIRMLLADGRLEAEAGGTCRPVGDLGSLEVPGSLQALIAARLDGLDPVDRSLLQDASVLGQTFSVPSLAAVSGQSEGDLEPRLRDLIRRELLELDTDPRSPERGQYGFVQALIREVAYGTLAKKDRRARHLAAARFFESMGDEELAGALATHYAAAYEASPEGPEAAALAVQARIALRAAAERAAILGAPGQALGYLDSAIDLAEGPDADELLERAGAIAATTGRHADAERYLLRAVDGHRSRGDRTRTAVAVAALARALINGGRADAGIATLETAVAEYAELLEDEPGAALCSALAWAHMRRQDDAQSIAWADRALVVAERLRIVDTIIDSLITKGAAYATAARPVEAIVVLEGCARLAEARGMTDQVLRAQVNLAITWMDDSPRRAVAESMIGIASARRLGHLTDLTFFISNGAEAATRSGEWEWAVAELDDLVAQLEPSLDRARLESVRENLRAVRGEPQVADLDRLATLFPAEEAPSLTMDPVIWRALAEGDFRTVIDQGSELARIDSLNAPSALDRVGRAAAWLGDVDVLRRAIEDLARVAR